MHYASLAFLLPVSSRVTHSTTTAPTKATKMDPMFSPVTPGCPTELKSQAPAIAPTTPITRSPRTPPGPSPGITLFAIQPAMIPTIIHAMILIAISLLPNDTGDRGVGEPPHPP